MWVALAGGVGGAKLARGLAVAAAEQHQTLTIIVNTGDDFICHGLHISPDIDTVLYTLAGISNPDTGWGITEDTFTTLDQLQRMGEDTWFRLGDRDFATHIMRTDLLHQGMSLTTATQRLGQALGIPAHVRVLPMTDDPVATSIKTADGWIDFQEYFVHRQHTDAVQAIRLDGIPPATPTDAALEAISHADAIIFCPSNPIVSLGPILALPGMRSAIAHHHAATRIAVSPIIGGRALKGPADRMLEGLGYEVSATGVARIYEGLIDIFVLDSVDVDLAPVIAELAMQTIVTHTIMSQLDDSIALSRTITACITIQERR